MKNLITKDTINEVNSMIQSPDAQFNEFKILPGFCIRFGNIIVRKYGDSGLLDLDECVNKELFAQWKKDVGQLISKDFKKGLFTGYYEIKANDKRALLRRIEYNDLLDMKDRGFNHVSIGDYWYTIMRLIPVNGNYNDADALAEANLTVYESSYSEYDEKDVVNPFFDENQDQSGFALFDEPVRGKNKKAEEVDEEDEEDEIPEEFTEEMILDINTDEEDY